MDEDGELTLEYMKEKFSVIRFLKHQIDVFSNSIYKSEVEWISLFLGSFRTNWIGTNCEKKMEFTNEYKRHVLYFSFKSGKTATVAARNINAVHVKIVLLSVQIKMKSHVFSTNHCLKP